MWRAAAQEGIWEDSTESSGPWVGGRTSWGLRVLADTWSEQVGQ